MGSRNRFAFELSVVVPVFDEVGSLPQLFRELQDACSLAVKSYEIVFVNDGSKDGSAELLDSFAESSANVVVVHLRRNFGKSPALAAGFERARGEYIITMDADLQDDPAMIPDFIERLRAGADLVSGWKQRRHDPLDKTLPSRLFNYVLRRVSGVNLRDFNCGFKAYRAECARDLRVYGGFHRFLPVFANERGFRVEELVVQHRPRQYGQSKFGKKRLFEGLLDLLTVLLLTRYRTRPLHFFGVPGAFVFALGVAILSYLTIIWFQGHSIGTRPLLSLGVLLTITGLQILCVGLVAEVIVRNTIGRTDVFAIREVRESASHRKVRREGLRAEVAPR